MFRVLIKTVTTAHIIKHASYRKPEGVTFKEDMII